MTNKMKITISVILGMTILFLIVKGIVYVPYAQETDEQVKYEIEEDTISENDTTEYGTEDVDVFGEDETINAEGVYPLAQYKAAKDYWYDKVDGEDYRWVTLPDAGTWGFDQKFARESVFPAMKYVRSNSENWWVYKDTRGEAIVDEKYGPYGYKLKDTTKVDLTQYPPIASYPVTDYVYDYELERCAMQRCIELAWLTGHERPDGQSCDEVFLDLDSYYKYADFTRELNTVVYTEAPYKDATEVTGMDVALTFMEENGMAEQEHRKNILTNSLYRIGIACIYTKGREGFNRNRLFTEIIVAGDSWDASKLSEDGLWETGVGYQGNKRIPLPTDDEYPLVVGYKAMEVREIPNMEGQVYLLDDRYQNTTNADGEYAYGFVFDIGETYDIEDKYLCMSANGIAMKTCGDCDGWKSLNESVATIDEDLVIHAVGAGTAEIVSCGSNFENYTLHVNVKAPQVVEKPSNTQTPENTTEIHNTEPAQEVVNTEGAEGDANTTAARQKPNAKYGIKLSPKSKTVKYKRIKKKSFTYKISPIVNNGTYTGPISYEVSKCPSGCKKYISVNKKTGKVKLKKGAKKGAYKIKVTVKASNGYKKNSKIFTIKVK